jgi:hypothetical protein
MSDGTKSWDMSEEQRSVLDKYRKLMAMASSSTHAEEKKSFEAKAADLLLKYNLDASAIADGDSGSRAQEKLKGGFYRYQRDLWEAVAEVNFCLHFYQKDWVERPEEDRRRKKVQERYSEFAQMYRRQHLNHIVGRRINVEATKFTVRYLLDAIERLTREFVAGRPIAPDERIVGLGEAMRSPRATAFREGAAYDIVRRLWDKRSDQIAEEKRKMAENDARMKAAASAAPSSSTTLTIAAFSKSERDANIDEVYGEGTSAKWAAQSAQRAAAARAAEEAYTQWAAANPEEARKQREEEEKAAKKRRARRTSAGSDRYRNIDSGAFWAGRDRGATVGLDPQTTHAARPRMIGAA